VAIPHLPSGQELSRELADEFGYPLTDRDNLARVAQFIATTHQGAFARRKIQEKILRSQRKFDGGDRAKVPQNYTRLAALSLPIYLTTNYDDFLARAISAHTGQKAWVEISRWSDRLAEELGRYPTRQPSADSPLLFHLHGVADNVSSIVATEDDYIDFMVSLANRGMKERDGVLPHWVRRALAQTTLLFVGYSMNDWNFRVLMRHLMKQQKILRTDQYFSVSIQMPPDDKLIAPDKRKEAEQFLSDYVGTTAIQILWVTAEDFLSQLQERVAAARARLSVQASA
jgi:hypothetical protein